MVILLLANPQRGKAFPPIKGGEIGQHRSKVEFLSSGQNLGGGSVFFTRSPLMGPRGPGAPREGRGVPCGSAPKERVAGACKNTRTTSKHIAEDSPASSATSISF